MMRERSVRVALLATLLVAFVLRVYRLDYQELRGDEAFGYFFSLREPADMVRATLDLQEPHPVASYLAQHAWLAVAGHSEFALRFSSVWFSVLAVALLARLALELRLARMTALLAAALLAVSPYAVWHAQDARMYSMSLALTLAATLCMVLWLQQRRWIWALAYVSAALLALHIHYFAAFVLVAHYLFVVGQAVADRAYRWSLLPWLAIQACVAVLYLPWLFLAAGTLTAYGGNGTSPDTLAAVQQAFAAFSVGTTFGGRSQRFWAATALLLAGIGLWRLFRSGERTVRAATLLALYLGIPLLATWSSAQQRPIFDARYLVAAAPPFYVLSAAAVGEAAAQGWKRRAALQFTSVAMLVLVMMGALLGTNRTFHDPAYSKTRGWRELATTITRMAAGLPPEQVRIAQNFPDPTLWYYYNGSVAHVVLPPAAHDAAGAARAVSTLVDEGVRRVILPQQPSPLWDDAGLARNALESGTFLPVREEQVGVWPVALYAAAPSNAAFASVSDVFENGMRTAAVDSAATELTPDGYMTPLLFWSGLPDGAAEPALKASVQLLGPDGVLVAQDDRALVEVQATDTGHLQAFALRLPPVLPAGTYRLIAVVYAADQEGNPRLSTVGGQDHVELETFVVMPPQTQETNEHETQ